MRVSRWGRRVEPGGEVGGPSCARKATPSVQQLRADRLLAAREADGQRTRGVVQRHAASGVFGRVLVRDADRGQANHRGLEAGIQ